MTAQPAPQAFSERSCGHTLPRGSKHCPYCRTPRLSAEPLAVAIRTRADVLGTVRQVSVEIATRLNLRFDSVDRQVRKILSGQLRQIDLYTADTYAVALGEDMPALLWGDEWERANPTEPYGDEGAVGW